MRGIGAYTGDCVRAQVSQLSRTRRAQVGMSRYSGRGRHEKWNGRYPVSEKMSGLGTLQRSKQGRSTGPRLGKYQDGRSWCVGPWMTLKDIPGIGARRGGGLTSGCKLSGLERADSEEGGIAEVQRGSAPSRSSSDW